MAVEVVGGEVEEDGALGGEARRVLELEAGGLADDGRAGVELAGQRGERRADVPGDRDRLRRRSGRVPEQLGGGRLAVRAGDGDEAVRDRPPGQLELADDVDPALEGGARSPAASWGTPGLLTTVRVAVELRKSIRIQDDFDAGTRKPCRALRLPGVDPDHLLAALGQQPCRRLPRARQAGDQERARGQLGPRLLRRRRSSSEMEFRPRAPGTCTSRRRRQAGWRPSPVPAGGRLRPGHAEPAPAGRA